MRDPAHVRELKKNAAAGTMHRLGDPLPAGDLFTGVDAGEFGPPVPCWEIAVASVIIRPATAR